MKKRKHILVFRLSALGDVAMTLPVIYSVAAAYPDTTFHVVTSAFCAQLFVAPPANVVVHGQERPVSTWRILQTVRSLHIDAVADLHNVSRSWLTDAFFLMQGKRVCMLNKRRSERKRLINGTLQQSERFIQRYFDVFRRLGLPAEPAFRALDLSSVTLPSVSKAAGEQWVGIAPFARYMNKAYPADLMEQVVSRLSSVPGVRVVLFGGGPQETAVLNGWAQCYPNVTTYAGQFKLPQELQLMSLLDVMVSMDSANMHLASLVGTRVVSIWGSTTPACGFLGYGQQDTDALCLHLDCQPCTVAGSKTCPLATLDCMKSLAPTTVVEKILDVIGRDNRSDAAQ